MLYKLENLKNNISEEVFVTHKKQDSMGTFVLFSFYQKRPQYSFDFLQHLSHHPTTLPCQLCWRDSSADASL
jgi:hypothetical protein